MSNLAGIQFDDHEKGDDLLVHQVPRQVIAEIQQTVSFPNLIDP